MSARRVKVLVVDDSAFARKVVREILERSPDLEVVGTARDGLDALEKIATLRPDVVTLDLVMPQLDGLGLLAALPSVDPPRVVVVSTAVDDSATVVAALQAGAVTAVSKPTAVASERLYEMADPLVAAVLRAAAARPLATLRPSSRPGPLPLTTRTRLVAVGASTGGPQALTHLLHALPATFPVPLAIVLHMPVGFTDAFARRLDETCALKVVEAGDGTELRPGVAVVARAGLHLVLDPRSRGAAVALEATPLDSPHRPSVDVLFASAARELGPAVLGVVMTGMGDDGLVGSRAIVDAGGRVITQSERSCVVYGMPRSVAEAGLSEAAVDLGELSGAIVRRL